MDALSYLCWSRAECSREQCKYELSLCVHLAHPWSFPPACSCQLHWSPVFVCISLFLFFHWILSSSSSFCPCHVLTSSYQPLFPSVLLSMSLFGTSDPFLVAHPLFFLFYSLTFSCINNVTLSSIPYSSAFPQCPLPPPLTTSSSLTCPTLGQSKTSSLSICLLVLPLSLSLPPLPPSPSLPLLTCLLFFLPWSSVCGLVELLALLPLLPLCLCNVP